MKMERYNDQGSQLYQAITAGYKPPPFLCNLTQLAIQRPLTELAIQRIASKANSVLSTM